MRQKIVPLAYAIILLFVMFAVVIPVGQAVEWSPDMRITWDNGLDRFPSIVQTDDGIIWVVWESIQQENLDIFYKVYNESSVHPWSPEVRLTTDQSADGSPSIMQALDGRLWVVWRSYRTGNGDIYRKTYNGSEWSPEEALITDPSVDTHPSIMQTLDHTIWLVFSSNRTGDPELYYATSSDNGETWEEALPLISNPGVYDLNPSIMQAQNGTIWLVWEGFGVYEDILYATYNGTSWSSMATVTADARADQNPSIMQAQDESIWVVWDSDRDSLKNDPYGNIYYNIYDGGWSGDTSLTTTTDDDQGASILQAIDGNVWIAWTSWRYNNQDIYYRTNSTVPGNDVSVFSVSPRTPTVTQGKNATIDVVAQNKGTNAQTFQVSCYADSSLIGTRTISLDPGQLNKTSFRWNTTNVAVGTYALKGEVSTVPGETYIQDNTYEDGTIDVLTHDVAVLNVWPSQTVAHRGYTTVYVYVEIGNEGNFTESFSVTAYYDHTAISTYMIVNMAPNTTTMLTYYMSKYLAYGNYTLSAKASPVPDELDVNDNSFTDDTVRMTIPGDVDGNGVVDESDLSKMSEAHGSSPMEPDWYPNCDTNNDNIIDIHDISLTGKNYGRSDT